MADTHTDVQVVMRNNDDSDRLTVECDVIGCEGILYFPEVNPEDLAGRMDTFRTMIHCTECSFIRRTNTAPKYLALRVIVRGAERRVSASS